MNCTNCGKSITPESSVTEEGYHFCNSLCRYEWRTKGKPSPFVAAEMHDVPSEGGISDLIFSIDPPGFENRSMSVKLGFLTGPRLSLDGELLKPVKSGVFRRKRSYRAVSNFGKEVSIVLRSKPLDQIPEMEIDGRSFMIARPLNGWEYAWMAIPVLLVSLGGFLGGVIGAAALFSNSILMRRIRHWVPRYILTGGTTLMAYILFFRVVTTVNPLLHTLLTPSSGITAEQQLVQASAEISRRCPFMLDEETRVDSVSAGPGKILTFHYALIKRSAGQLNIGKLKEALQEACVENVRSASAMKPLRDLGVTFVYRYLDKDRKHIVDVTVTPPEYGETR
jgi:hypothetical protein